MKKITVIIFCLMALYTQAQNTFPASGNVGIGTVSPSVTLDVNGAIRVGANQPIYFLGGPDDKGYLIQSGGWSNGMQYKHFTSHQFFTNGDNERLRIAQNGNVGIGTTNPSVTLDVNGAIRVGANQPIYFLGGPDDKEYQIRSGAWNDGMKYKHFTSHQFFTNGDNERLRIAQNGNVGIGTTNPTQKLSVNGTIQAKEIIVNTGWSDFVFDNNYKLRPLTEVEQFVKTNKHLPEIPSQKEVEKNGVQLGDISSKLLMKIEELTLYMIEMKEEIQTLQKENTALKKIINNPYKQ